MERDKITLALIFAFFAAWTYTEILEKRERDVLFEEFRVFHKAGARFTKENGSELAARVCALERLHGIQCQE